MIAQKISFGFVGSLGAIVVLHICVGFKTKTDLYDAHTLKAKIVYIRKGLLRIE